MITCIGRPWKVGGAFLMVTALAIGVRAVLSTVGPDITSRRVIPVGHPDDSDREAALKLVGPLLPLPALELLSATPVAHPSTKLPVSLDATRNGEVAISDNNAHKVFRLGIRSGTVAEYGLELGASPGLEWPNRVVVAGGKTYVADRIGLRVFRPDGSYEGCVQSFLHIVDFDVDEAATIWVVPSFRQVDPVNPLVVAIARDGRKLRSYGRSSTHSALGRLLNLAHVAAAEEHLALAFRHRPELVLFDKTTGESISLALRHPRFAALQRLDQDPAFNHPRPSEKRLSRYTAGITIARNRLVVLLDLPNIELWEYDLSGRDLGGYRWQAPQPISRYFGLAADPRVPDVLYIGVAYSDADAAVVAVRIPR